MKKVRVSGVPEHFNLPWHLCIESGEYEENGINVEWTDVPEGTGKLCQMLRENETDIAVILTEGIIKDIIQGYPIVIVQQYVQSPLIWGIHVDGDSNISEENDLKGKTVAISRMGSGSQLMAMVHASNKGWDPTTLNYEIVNTIDGAVQALRDKNADYFMWERFMTKPLVDKGVFKHIGDCPTPWPSFVIAVREEFINQNRSEVQMVLNILNITTSEFKDIPSIDRMLASRYEQKLEDIQQWLSKTRWSQKNFRENEFIEILNQLIKFKVINTKVDYKNVVVTL